MMVLCVLDLLFKAQAMVPTSNLIFAVIILMLSVIAPATASPLEDAVAANAERRLRRRIRILAPSS
jgi:hypothetical protein